MKQRFQVIAEDDWLVYVCKPSGLLTLPHRYEPHLPNLQAQLNRQFGKLFTLHRLDKGTSGLLVFAKTAEAHRAMSRLFEQRAITKKYRVLVSGHPQPPTGTIRQPLATGSGGKVIPHSKGKSAITHYKVLEHFETISLVEAELETGRTHQIRVHFQYIGYPLITDPLYGARQALFLSDFKTRHFKLGRRQVERPLLQRSALHAFQLEFEHPFTGSLVRVECPLPKDLDATLRQLRKWSKI